MLTIDDFVMLGTTVPEPSKTSGRIFVCSAGVSPQIGALLRIYPLARRHAPSRWSVNTVMLQRNPRDNRRESWMVAGDRTEGAHERINDAFTRSGTYPANSRATLLAPYTVGSIDEANARRLSLAVLHPDAIELDFKYNPDSPDSPELRLFPIEGQPPTGARRFAFIPRLHFRDEARDNHLNLREWGCFEFLRKHGDDRRHELPAALHLDPSCSLLVGNHNQHRTAWLVISILHGLRTPPSLFDELTEAS